MAGTTPPNATTTGVPEGTKLTAYTGPMTITQPGTVIDGKIINGTLRVQADNVVIKNSQINFTGWWGVDAEGSKNLTIQDSDITGPGYAGTSNSAILGSGNFLRNDISKVENGITLLGGASVVKGNYIHNLENSGSDPHYDGIQVYGGQNGVLIEGNTVLARDTSSIFIANLTGAVNNVKVNANYLAGADVSLRVEGTKSSNPITDVSITNNYVEKGYWGYYNIEKASPTMSGNIEFLKGTMTPDKATLNVSGTLPPEPTQPEEPGTLPPEPTQPETPGPDNHTFMGTPGNDTLPAGGASNSGNEKFYGLAGNDVLRGGAGADHLDGGTGTDTASYAGSNAAVNVRLDTMKASGGHATGDTLVSIENLTGSDHNDTLRGNSGANVLDGGAGADYMAGGKGNDTYIVDNARDVVVENSGSGMDVVRSSISHTLVSNVEELVLTGSANINGTGNTGANVLRGNSGNNALNGHNGNDVIYGGLGNDVLTGGYGKDAFVFNTALNATNNVDRITDFSVVDDIIHLDHTVFAAIGDSLSSSEFVKNTTGLAQDSNDRIIYETDTGKLFYDSNGNASGGSVHFATLNANLALTSADFAII